MIKSRLAAGVACVATSVLCWGGMFPVAKRTLPVIDAFALGSIRYVIGAAIFVALLVAAEGRRALGYEGRFTRAALFGLFGFTGFTTFVFLGLTTTRPEHAAIILTLQAPLAALAVWLAYGQRPAAFTLGCAAAALVGVAWVVTGGSLATALAGGTLGGDLLVLAGGVSWVIYTLAGRHFPGWSLLRLTALTCIPGSAGLLAVEAVAVAAGWSHVPTIAALVSVKWQITYLALFTVVLAVLCFNAGVRFIGPLNTVLMLNLVPVMVFVVEASLGRHFGAHELGGAALVIASLVANNLYLRRAARAREAPQGTARA